MRMKYSGIVVFTFYLFIASSDIPRTKKKDIYNNFKENASSKHPNACRSNHFQVKTHIALWLSFN